MNLYEILHISQDAPVEIIKLAYKGLAQKYHPDRYKGDDANEIMVKIREAYETLIDPVKRKNYDSFLAEQARRKQHQEEYVKRQQQEEFARSQRENFKREANSSAQSQTKETNSGEATKDFSINLSIKIPRIFSIFEPFIKLFEWLKSKKRVFVKILVACFILSLLALIGVMASHYATNINSNTDQEEKAIADAHAAAQEAVNTAEDAQAAAQEAVNEAESNSTPIYENIQNQTAKASMNVHQTTNSSAPEFSIYNDPSEIRDISEKTLDVFFEIGLLGLQGFVKDCYRQGIKINLCIYAEIASRYIHDSGVEEGVPELDFFTPNRIDERLTKNLYYQYNLSHDEYIEYLNRTTKETIDAMNKALAERGYS